MTKTHTKFVCDQCGYEAAKWLGRCPDCGEWNSLVETVVAPGREADRGKRSLVSDQMKPVSLPQVRIASHHRMASGSAELDRVLGGGIVAGSLVLLGGEPGIGKSTLALRVAGDVASATGPVLYVSAEESAEQVKLRADRLGISSERLFLFSETDLDVIIETTQTLVPSLLIIDSIQTVAVQTITSAPGSISQVRECTLRLMRLAKTSHIPVMLIGHVTKEGLVAGPRALEHIVDAVLYLEGERFHSYRLLRGTKNRFGATNETGVFEMRGEGMCDVENPSALFLSGPGTHTSGSTVVVSMEGTRPLMIEVQALVSTTSFGTPRYSANGIDHNRMVMLLAVLTRRVGLSLGNQDVYLNIAGGFTIGEPAVDLGVATAIASSFRERRVSQETVMIGEVGLGGELRAVTRMNDRLREAAKLGFKTAVLPVEGKPGIASTSVQGIELVRVATVGEALAVALQ